MTQPSLATASPRDLLPRTTFGRVFWSGDGLGLGAILAYGALVWSLYAALVVLRNGVVLDQDIVPAQVIAGSVHYPPGHPHLIFYTRVFNLPTYLLAGLWALRPDPIVLSALRNWIFAFLSAFVPFSLAAVLTRKPAWGHAAALLTFSEASRRFAGRYPTMVFPNFNSDGHMGSHAAVLIVVLLIAGLWRWGGTLLGLLPAIHPTMAVIVWPWSICYFFLVWRSMDRRDRKRLLLSICAGLTICGALAGFIALTAAPANPAPPYDSQANGPLIYHQFEVTTDAHREPFVAISYGYLGLPLMLFGLMALCAWKNDASTKVLTGLLLLSLLVWAYVGGTWLLQRITHWLPLFVQISMPARFSNLSIPLVIPLAVAAIARVRPAPGLIAALLLIQAVFTLRDYNALPLYFIFAIAGAAVVAHLYLRAPQLFRRVPAMPSWCAPVSFLLAMLVSLGIPSDSAWVLRSLRPGRGYRFQPYDRQLNAWLAEHASPDEFILVPTGPPSELQVKTGHPVMMELETLYLMTYKPDLAPVIGAMARDFWGLDYTNPARLASLMSYGRIFSASPPLTTAWLSKTADEWRLLGRKYKFRLVLSLTQAPLPLVKALPGPQWTLYTID